ncbi:MAG: hypothetical protein JSV16_10595 [Candidatus Hydrogenedentota bacterium]|nr:MAG: hypothetical protein JSV16_10595 [Candidatus Hydrogenedentota bacterium]
MTNPNPRTAYRASVWHAAATVAATILIYILLLLYHIAPYNYNLSSLIRIGAANPFFNPAALEPGLVVFNDPESGGDGYDGQFYYYTIKQLLMKERGIPNPFRFQRILYPTLAYLFAAGRPELLPLSMLVVNLAAIAASGVLLWRLIQNVQLRPEHLFVYTLNIGFLIAVFYDVATPICICLIVAAAYFYSREKLWLASAMLALSLLTQENGSIVLAALCAWLMWKRNWRSAFTLAAAIGPWAIWQAVLWSRYGDFPLWMSGYHFRLPLSGMISQIASLQLPGEWLANLRELSVYPFMLFVLLLLIVSAFEMKKRPSEFTLVLLLHALVGICFNKEQIWGSTITSPARALAGIFPFLLICYARERSLGLRVLLGIGLILTLMGIARILLMPPHPFYVI